MNFHDLAVLAQDDGDFGEPVREVVRTRFKNINAVSVGWIATGRTHVVRYEALYADPVSALVELTGTIAPVSLDRVERAVERHDMGIMRALLSPQSAFFRKGGSGGWRDVLPGDVVELLRTTEPYPSQLATLGYTLDADDLWSDLPLKRPTAKAGFLDRAGHSKASTLLLKAIYLSFESDEAAQRWPDVHTAAMPTSFHRWLAAPADADSRPGDGLPQLTNFAAHVHASRLDLQVPFQDLYGQHRLPYLFWLLEHGADEYQLDDTLVGPVRAMLTAWATRPDPGDPANQGPSAEPAALTNLARFVYQRRPDLRAAFPDLYGRQRLDFLLWLIEHAAGEYQLDDACVAPLRREFLAWAMHPGGPAGQRRRAYLSRYLLQHKRIEQTTVGRIIRALGAMRV